LAEIAPQAEHPLRNKTIAELLAEKQEQRGGSEGIEQAGWQEEGADQQTSPSP
jgi:hypothetical protein